MTCREIGSVAHHPGSHLTLRHMYLAAPAPAYRYDFHAKNIHVCRQSKTYSTVFSVQDAAQSAHDFMNMVATLNVAIYGTGVGASLDFTTFTNGSLTFADSNEFTQKLVLEANTLHDQLCALSAPPRSLLYFFKHYLQQRWAPWTGYKGDRIYLAARE
jgi:hypothetical protein